MSDIFADVDDAEYDKRMREQDMAKIQREFYNDGFREGVDDGREQRVQEGFNEGFISTFQTGLRSGQAKGQLSAIKTVLTLREHPELEHINTNVSAIETRLDSSTDDGTLAAIEGEIQVLLALVEQ